MNDRNWVALSIRQPWIDLILRGLKTIEVRSWEVKRRGPILLHASLTVDWKAIEIFGYIRPLGLPRGRLVGYAEIADTFEFSRESWLRNVERHLVVHPMIPPAYGSVLEGVRPFAKPVPCPGKLMFFPIPHRVVENARCELEKLNITW